MTGKFAAEILDRQAERFKVFTPIHVRALPVGDYFVRRVWCLGLGIIDLGWAGLVEFCGWSSDSHSTVALKNLLTSAVMSVIVRRAQ